MSTEAEPLVVQKTLPKPARATSRLLRAAILLMALLLVIAFTTQWETWIGGSARQSTDDAYLQADLTPLSARVGGYVRAVPVLDYQRVQAGDVLVEIVDDDYRAQLAQGDAAVAGGLAAIDNLAAQRSLQETNITAVSANLQAVQATYVRYHLEAQRQRQLLASRVAGTEQAVEQADANERQNAAQIAQVAAHVEAARRQLDVLDTQRKQLQAALAGQEAMRDLARINLAYTRIAAPRDGVVGQRQVRPGQYVSVGTTLIGIVPPRPWVLANYKETQLTRVRTGQPARVTIDAFPGKTLRGHVDSISPASGSQFSLLPADNATGNFTKVVQRISVKILLDDTAGLDELLRAGMSVTSTIDATGAL